MPHLQLQKCLLLALLLVVSVASQGTSSTERHKKQPKQNELLPVPSLRQRHLEDAVATNETMQIFPFPGGSADIINGDVANAGEFPYYVLYEGNVLCGGALIAPDIAVTAAHCIDGEGPPSVRIGGRTRNSGTGAQVCDVITHPRFQSQTLSNDVAVLVLCNTVQNTFTNINTNGALPTTDTGLTAMGFGRTDANQGGGSNTLQKLSMEYIPDDQCLREYPDHRPNQNMCIDRNNGGICFGDSGSPVVDAAGTVYGVASFVVESCDSNFPDGFTRMSSYSTWVHRQVCEQSQNPPADIDCANLGDDDGPPPDDEGDDGDDGTGCVLLDLLIDLFDIFLGGVRSPFEGPQ